MSTITTTCEDRVAHLTINRAEKHNALTQDMWQAIADACDQLATQSDLRVLVLQGAGDKAFCAGADIEELGSIIQDPQRLKQNNEIVQLAQQKLEALPCMTIAQIRGACVGGGMGLALACDFRVCDNNATFAITPSKLGLMYSLEDTRRLVNILGLPRAKELLFLGNKMDASTAQKWGLVNQCVPTEHLQQTVKDLVQNALNISGASIRGMKQTLSFLCGSAEQNEEAIRRLFNEAFTQADFLEGASAFLQKRPPEFP